jgi:hypothetical protein
MRSAVCSGNRKIFGLGVLIETLTRSATAPPQNHCLRLTPILATGRMAR